jgi:hypothetical protein
VNSHFLNLCDMWEVNPMDLFQKIQDGLIGVDIRHFTDEELRVIHTALVIASE